MSFVKARAYLSCLICTVFTMFNSLACTSTRLLSEPEPACETEIVTVIEAALEHGLGGLTRSEIEGGSLDRRSPRIPDLGIAYENDKIHILNRVQENKCLFDGRLPAAMSNELVLITEPELKKQARRKGDEGFPFVHVSGVEIDAFKASVWLGVAIELPPNSKAGLMCCCGGSMLLEKVQGRWVFAGWGLRVCA